MPAALRISPALCRALVVLALLLPTAAVADPLASATGVRQIGKETYLVDRAGRTVGTIRELSPGNWHIMDSRGNTVRTIQVPKGCVPFMACPGR